jgi:hypothetical protein
MKMSYSRRTRRPLQREGAEEEEEAGQPGARTCPGVTGPKTSILPGGAGGRIPGSSTGTSRDQRRSGAATGIRDQVAVARGWWYICGG